MKILFVTGTDTGVGKTWISCLLIRQLNQQGARVGAYKPVCSGADSHDDGLIWTDAEQLSNACQSVGIPSDRKTKFPLDNSSAGDGPNWQEMICPQRFLAPLAPPFAAKLEGRSVDRTLLRAGLQRWKPHADVLIVEGAGGLLCPISEQDTFADLAAEFPGELIIVASNRLGVVNHALMTCEVAARRGIKIRAIILNECSELPTDQPSSASESVPSSADLSRLSNASLLTRWIDDLPLFHCAFQSLQLTPVNSTAHSRPLDLNFIGSGCVL